MSNLRAMHLESPNPSRARDRKALSDAICSDGVTLLWVERPRCPHAARASADYVSRRKLGVHLDSPAPVGTRVWIVLGSGSGFQGVVRSCDLASEGYQAEVRLMRR